MNKQTLSEDQRAMLERYEHGASFNEDARIQGGLRRRGLLGYDQAAGRHTITKAGRDALLSYRFAIAIEEARRQHKAALSSAKELPNDQR
jgi:hypothetical protein